LYAVRRGEIIISGVFAMQENPSKTEVRKKRAESNRVGGTPDPGVFQLSMES
jgi:hypothetical protein